MKSIHIGPFRGGRTVGAVGIPSQPNVFYIGVNNGGVWKTTDAGRTWKPIFDDQPTGSIGDIAVAPSNPNVIYVGSGEGLQRPDLSTGDGMYKSTDGGKTWEHLGSARRPADRFDRGRPERMKIAFLSRCSAIRTARTRNAAFTARPTAAKSFQRVLYKDENTGAIQVEFDPKNSKIVYADLWAGRQGPWENGAWQGKESGLFKSTDGGNTWKKLTNGLPTIEQGLGRIGFAISRSDPKRLYATVDANPKFAGIYVSNDAGDSWTQTNSETRIWGRGSDFAEVKVHPNDPNTIFVANTATYKSTDGGKTFTGFKGAPGGDDYHRIWINPEQPDIMLFASDQGRRSRSMAARHGRAGTTSRRPSFITSSPTTNIRIGFTAASRRAARRALRRAAIRARSLPGIGERSGPRNTAMSHPTRSTRISFTAANCRALISEPDRCKTSCPRPFAPENTGFCGPLR